MQSGDKRIHIVKQQLTTTIFFITDYQNPYKNYVTMPWRNKYTITLPRDCVNYNNNYNNNQRHAPRLTKNAIDIIKCLPLYNDDIIIQDTFSPIFRVLRKRVKLSRFSNHVGSRPFTQRCHQ